MGLNKPEYEALLEFLRTVTDRKPPIKAQTKDREMVKVTVEGESRVELVKRLRAFADNLDGAPATKTGKVISKAAEEEVEEVEEVEETEEDTDFAPPKKTGKKAGASFEDETEPEAEAEAEEEAPAPKKSAKTKAPTKADVTEACKAHAKKHGFDVTKALLMKKFKTSSMGALDEKQYAAVIAAVKV